MNYKKNISNLKELNDVVLSRVIEIFSPLKKSLISIFQSSPITG